MSVDVKTRLDEIAAAIKRGANPAKFEKEMDQLLGIKDEPARDEEADEIWERAYRNRD